MTYKSHLYFDDGKLLVIEGTIDGTPVSIRSNESTGVVHVFNGTTGTIFQAAASAHACARRLANIIFNTNKEYAS